jgi:hypothetical protein
MRNAKMSWLLVAGLTLLLLLVPAGTAFAHEQRTVGAYRFTVGWGQEPAYAGSQDSIQCILADTKTGKPVTDLTDSLKVEVIFGTQRTQLSLEPTFDPDTGLGTPGDYRAWFIPTAPGSYSFHLFGSIGSQRIDQTFTSGPQTFDEVTDPTTVEFPAKPPTNVQLSDRMTREFPRLARQIAASEAVSKDRASSAKVVGYIGIGAGALGLLVGAWALIAARRMTRHPVAAEAEPRG